MKIGLGLPKMRPRSRKGRPLRYHFSLSARHTPSSAKPASSEDFVLVTCKDHRYAEFWKMLPTIGRSKPGAMGAEVAMALSGAGGCAAAAQAVKPEYPSPTIATRPSLHGCLAIQRMIARASSPSC